MSVPVTQQTKQWFADKKHANMFKNDILFVVYGFGMFGSNYCSSYSSCVFVIKLHLPFLHFSTVFVFALFSNMYSLYV